MSQLASLKHLSQGTLKYKFKCFVFVAFEVPLDQDNIKKSRLVTNTPCSHNQSCCDGAGSSSRPSHHFPDSGRKLKPARSNWKPGPRSPGDLRTRARRRRLVYMWQWQGRIYPTSSRNICHIWKGKKQARLWSKHFVKRITLL